MAKAPTRDHRKPLQISQATWDREDEEGRKRLVIEATRLGRRLVVASIDGREWTPGIDPAEW